MYLMRATGREFCGAVDQRFLVYRGLYFWDLVIDLQEDGHASNVIDDCVVLSPFGGSCAHDGVACLLRAVLEIEGPDDLCDHFVGEELPNSITSYDYELVLRL